MERDGAVIRVVIGAAYGASSPVQTESETLYAEVKLDAGANLELPAAEEIGIFVVEGDVSIGADKLLPGGLTVLKRGAVASLSAESRAHVMICGGATLEGERIVWWNFVSSSRDRIEQAKRDWREGRFASVPGEEDFIPLPENR